MKLHGIYALLVKLPIWAITAILVAISLAVLVGRDIFEGLMYNISYSSMVGDAALIICVLIAATILQRGQWGFIYVPKLLNDGAVQRTVFLGFLSVGVVICALTLSSRSGQAMDVYHDIIIAPIFLFLAITLFPVIVINGKRKEIYAVILLILLWAGLVVFDFKYDRINQRQWLQDHGVTFVLKK